MAVCFQFIDSSVRSPWFARIARADRSDAWPTTPTWRASASGTTHICSAKAQ